jgi:glycosyltransferase involved in cell wall biosynthesis
MRVLHLIPSLAGGGAERQIGILATGLVALGGEVHVGIVRDGVYLERVEHAGAKIHRIPVRGNYDPMLPLRIAGLIRRIRPDVVQTWLTQMDVAGGLAALLTRTPWIVSERTNKIYYQRDSKNRMRRLLGHFASAIVANSAGGAEYWEGVSVPRVVVPNALPSDEIDAAPRDQSDFGDSSIILFAGRLDAAKNLSNLIDALVSVTRSQNAIALLCGEGPLESEVRERIESAGAGARIRLLGFKDCIWSLMKRADVFVCSSWFEGESNAVLEAAACGCPLVLSDIPTHRDTFGDEAALYADPNRSAALADALACALTEREASRVRSTRAREISSARSIERAAASYLQVYEKVTS